jgi:NADH dehydrogenase (ubiquinone) 1 beta subcomplex subunit 8
MTISTYSRLNAPTRSAFDVLVTDVMLSQNGGYISPPRVKRQFRDPYGDWWDKQERRNYGEPVHEDNDILGMFSPEEYTHVTSGTAFFQLGCFVAAVLGLCGVVAMFYPDTPSVPREFEDGLERELGGPGALRVSFSLVPTYLNIDHIRHVRLVMNKGMSQAL